MPFPIRPYDEDPFAPEELTGEEVVEDIDTPALGDYTPYGRGIIDAPEFWLSPQIQGQGIDRPKLNDPAGIPQPEDYGYGDDRDFELGEEISFRPRAQMSTEQELDMVQQAMAPRGPFERGDRPGRPSGEGGGGNVVPFPKRQDSRDDFAGFRVWDKVEGRWVGESFSPKNQMEAQEALRAMQRRWDPFGSGTQRFYLEPFFKGE